MFPAERSLVEKHKDKPFVLLGVNSDPRETALDPRRREDVTWRSFWDGGAVGGPIASKWHVQGWPTIYILDAEGVIRYKSIGPMESLFENVDQLLTEMTSSH